MNESDQNRRLWATLAVLTAAISDLPAPILPLHDDAMEPWRLVAGAVLEARDLLNEIALERAS